MRVTASDHRAAECEVDLALRDAALHDLSRALGAEKVEWLYRTNTGFRYAVDTLLHAGWWPHSLDIETRRSRDDEARIAELAATAGMMRRADLLAQLGLT